MDNELQPSNTLPPEIQENLEKYRQHSDNITCFECGYTGLMGIKKQGYEPVTATALATLTVVLAAFMGFLGLMYIIAIFIVSWLIFLKATANPILCCPCCLNDFYLNRRTRHTSRHTEDNVIDLSTYRPASKQRAVLAKFLISLFIISLIVPVVVVLLKT